jgi:hypothetical protein
MSNIVTLIGRIKVKLKTKGHSLVKDENGTYSVIDEKLGSIILSKVSLEYLAEQVGEQL